MSESLTVDKFLGLPSLKLELLPLTLLIGPQATGKSVIAKLCYFTKGLASDVFTAIENDQTKSDLDASLSSKFLQYFPSSCWGSQGFSVTYKLGSHKVTIKRSTGKSSKPRISYSPFFSEKLEELRTEYRNRRQEETEAEPFKRFEIMSRIRKNLQDTAAQAFGPEIAFRQLFVPAGRSFFANLQSNVFSFLSSNNAMDPFLKEFGSFYENMKGWPGRFLEHDTALKEFTQRSRKLSEKVLSGRYVNEKGKDYLDLTDGRRISLANCSSGQQETLPLSLILAALPMMGHSGHSIYIEEPEAHLFPTSQRSVLEMIALTFNRMNPRLQALVTTHSPYILTALNNLIEAGRLHASNLKPAAQAQLNAVIGKDYALSPNLVRAYSVSRDGILSISDHDTGMINATAIDGVSQDIAVEFDKLLALDPNDLAKPL